MSTSASDSEPGSPTDASALRELVAECLDRIERDGEPAIEELCAEHPEHAQVLRRQIEVLREAGLVAPPDASSAAAAIDEVPELLGDFRLIESLGGGGMGIVYRAVQISLGREVALKLVRPDQLLFPGARERFRREVSTVAQLQHPGIVPIYTVGEERGVPYFAMELVRGCTLAELLDALAGSAPRELSGTDVARVLARTSGEPSDAPPPPTLRGAWVDVCLRVIGDVAEALEHAHRRGVLHRDVKPSNVMLTSAGRVLLLDFGLASTQGVDRLTRTGSQIGSLCYMAPEQLRGDLSAIDRRTDVYQLGVTLYELLALRLPFRAETQTNTIERILAARPPALRRLNQAVSVDAETVCMTAIDPDPARRYASAADFAQDLRNVLEHRPIAARRASAFRRTRRWIERRPALAASFALAFVVVVGGPLAYAWQQHRAGLRIAAKNIEIEDANASLRLALENLRVEKGHAEKNLETALDVTDRLLVMFGDKRLEHVPHMEEIRSEVLAEGILLYEQILERSGDDPGVRREMAEVHLKVGDIQSRLGRSGPSTEAYERARALFEDLARRAPSDTASEAGLARCDYKEGLLLRNTGRISEALALQERARTRLEKLVLLQPDVPEHREHLAIVLQDMGPSLWSSGRVDEALDGLGRGIEIEEALVREYPEVEHYKHHWALAQATLTELLEASGKLAHAEEVAHAAEQVFLELSASKPEHSGYRDELAGVVMLKGRLARARGKTVEAEACFRRAIELEERLVRDFPGRLDFKMHIAKQLDDLAELELDSARPDDAVRSERHALAILEPLEVVYPDDRNLLETLAGRHGFLGTVLHRTGRTDEAEASYRRAVAEFGVLTVGEPSNASLASDAAGAIHNLGSFLMKSDRLDEARVMLQRSVEMQRTTLERNPELSGSRELLRNANWTLCEVELRRKDHAAAARIAEELPRILPKPFDEYRRAGEFLARCAALAAEEDTTSEVQRKELAFAYANRAVALLRQAVQRGDLDLAYYRTEPDLEILRERPDFQELVSAVEATTR